MKKLTVNLDNVKEIQDLIKKIIKQIAGEPLLDEELIPEYCIRGTGKISCYHPSNRIFVKIRRGQKVYALTDIDPKNKILIFTTCGRMVIIDYDELYFTEFD
jgi:hypothetical protein